MKTEAEAVFDRLGLSSTQAVKLFFRQVALRQSIPFALTLNPTPGISQQEEAMLAASLEDVAAGRTTTVDMSNAQRVAELFGI